MIIIENQAKWISSKCQQCGACRSVCPQLAISYVGCKDGITDVRIDDFKCIGCKKCNKVCPANRTLTKTTYVPSLSVKKYALAYNENSDIRHDSSSGGVCKTLIIESLKNALVDGVYSLRKLDQYPSAIGEFYTIDNIPSFDDIPNSVYHSIMACTEIEKVHKVKRLMLVGTSCQLYALETALKGKYEELIKVCIFCKQQKTLGSTKFLSKLLGTSVTEPYSFKSQYRGTGWPGVVSINDKSIAWEKAAGLPFGRRLWCVPGCDICGDPFGIEVGADVTLMDPWSIRSQNDLGETLVTIHTESGEQFLKSIPNLVVESKSYEEVRPALGEGDIWRKRALVPYFKGEEVPAIIKAAGDAEVKQRRYLERILELTPRMPFIFYQVLNKVIPKKRDKILKEKI